jgi:D-inositol-3-phosphate glycosyltransferase
MTVNRVAIVSIHASPLARLGGSKSGGLNVYVRELARELVRHGCQVDIYSRATSRQTPQVVEIEPGLRAIHLEVGPARVLSPEHVRPHLEAFEAAVLAFAGESSIAYDLVHSHYWLSGLVGIRLAAAWRVPHVTMFHTLGEIKNRASRLENESPARIEAERAIAAAAHRVVCATPEEKAELVRLYAADPARLSVIPLGVDLEQFRPLDRAAARGRLGLGAGHVVLFVGRLEPIKGVDILISAAAMVESDADCKIVIVGGDDESAAAVAALREQATALGIAERVVFAGAVDHRELPFYYNAADVCVIPSHHESFGLVAVEAMACGVPVVASRVGGLTRTVRDGETGYLIPWLCPEPFAERIELLLDNEPLRRGLGEGGREAVYRYRWESVASAILELYESVQREQALRPTGT